jgi:hypothetical protein
MRAILALGAIVVSTAALAQLGQNSSAGPDNGFFRPTPGNDPSVHAPVVATPPVPLPQPQPRPEPPVVPVYVPVQAPTATPQRQARAAEQELDRAQREALDAQQGARQQPAPINGAFTGNTDPRNR